MPSPPRRLPGLDSARITLRQLAGRLPEADPFRHEVAQLAAAPVRDRWTFLEQSADALARFVERYGSVDEARAAIASLQEALAAVPDRADAQNALGRMLVVLGSLELSPERLRQACQAYDKALALADEPAFRCRVWINKAAALCQQAQLTDGADGPKLLEEAAALLRHALAARPANIATALDRIEWPRAQETLANILLARDETAEAIALLREAGAAWARDEDRANALNTLGFAYDKAGRFPEAMAAFDEALRLQSPDVLPLAWSRTQFNRGRALLHEGLKKKDHEVAAANELFTEAFQTLSAARERRPRDRMPGPWAETTLQMGIALVNRGAADDRKQILSLFGEALPYMDDSALPAIMEYLYHSILMLYGSDESNIAASAGKAKSDIEEALANDFTETMDQLRRAIRNLAALAEIPPDRRLDFETAITEEVRRAKEPSYAKSHRPDPESIPPIPTQAPELYANRAVREDLARKESIVEFLERVYGTWIRAGALSRPDLRRLDPNGEMALRNWLRHNDIPTGWSIPTRSEVVGAEVKDPTLVREARRIISAYHRHAYRP